MTRYSDFVQRNQKNALFNGNFENWPEGLGPYAGSLAVHTALMTLFARSGSGEYSITASSSSKPNDNCNYVHKVEVTTAEASVESGDYAGVLIRVEGYDYYPFRDEVATLSFWVRSSVTGIYCVSFRSSINDASYIVEYTINSADTWEYKTIPITFSEIYGTWDITNGRGLNIWWSICAGATYQTGTTDNWVSGNYLATSNQVNGAATIGNTFQLSHCQLELGSVATDYEYIDIASLVQLVRRYYQYIPLNHMIATCVQTGSGIAYLNFEIPVILRAAPTVTNDSTQMWNPNTGWRATTSVTNSTSTYRNLAILYDTGYSYTVYWVLLVIGNWYFDARL